jgi:hypothetical protein
MDARLRGNSPGGSKRDILGIWTDLSGLIGKSYGRVVLVYG